MPLTLHGFASTLLSDPEAMAAYNVDPQGALDRAGLADITPQDVQEIFPLVTELGAGYGNFGALGLDGDTGHAVGGVHTPEGDYQAGGILDTSDGPTGTMWVSTPDGGLALDTTPDGATLAMAGGLPDPADTLDSLDLDAIDMAGGAGSVAGLLSSGADLGPLTSLPGGGLGALDADALDSLDPLGTTFAEQADAAQWDDSLGDTGPATDGSGMPMDGVPAVPADLPAEAPAGLPQLPGLGGLGGVELPVQLPQLPALPLPDAGELPLPAEVADTVHAADATFASLPSAGVTDGISDAVASGPAGALLSDVSDSTDGLAGLDEHLPL
jgi:hypothetical protein